MSIKDLYNKFEFKFLERYLGGHKRIGNWTIYGFNAMNVAVNVWVDRLDAYLCFHPTVYARGRVWPWKFYVSRNATPWAAVFAAGPGVSRENKEKASERLRDVLEKAANP